MKNQFTYILLFISAGILLSCCSQKSGMYFTKRHYRNGYYVESRGTKEISEPQKVYNEEAVYASQEKIISYVIEQSSLLGKINLAENENVVTKSNELAGKTNKDYSLKHTKTSLKSASTRIATKNLKRIIKNYQAMRDEPGDEARSWFWTVILAVALLWLVGILVGGFGLGWLIHLLLVIALILLILWLLRIV